MSEGQPSGTPRNKKWGKDKPMVVSSERKTLHTYSSGSSAGEQHKLSSINFPSSTKLARTLTYCIDLSLLKALLLCQFKQEHWRYLMLQCLCDLSFSCKDSYIGKDFLLSYTSKFSREYIKSVIPAPQPQNQLPMLSPSRKFTRPNF